MPKLPALSIDDALAITKRAPSVRAAERADTLVARAKAALIAAVAMPLLGIALVQFEVVSSSAFWASSAIVNLMLMLAAFLGHRELLRIRTWFEAMPPPTEHHLQFMRDLASVQTHPTIRRLFEKIRNPADIEYIRLSLQKGHDKDATDP